jgi:hypothetical protein
MFCTNCGAKVEDSWKFCNSCGAALKPIEGVKISKIENSSNSWLPNKEYRVRLMDYEEKSKYRNIQRDSELKTVFYGDNFVVLEDGTQIGFVYGHISKYKGEESFYYNLYKLTPNGTATFLGAGIRGNIESFYVLNGVAYCEYCNDKMEVKID